MYRGIPFLRGRIGPGRSFASVSLRQPPVASRAETFPVSCSSAFCLRTRISSASSPVSPIVSACRAAFALPQLRPLSTRYWSAWELGQTGSPNADNAVTVWQVDMVRDTIEGLHRISFELLLQIALHTADPLHPLKNLVLFVGQNDPNAAQSWPVQGIKLLRARVPLEHLMEIFAPQAPRTLAGRSGHRLRPPAYRGRE